MSKKNTLEAKRQRKVDKQKDRGYPEYYQQVTDDMGRTHLVGQKASKQVDTLKKLFAKMYVTNSLSMLGIREVVEGEVV